MIDAAVLRAMAAAGASTEVIIAAVEAAQAADEARKEAKRAGNAERQQRFRDRRKTRKTQRNDSNALRSVTPPIDITHTPHSVISSDDEKQNTPRKQRESVGVRPDDIPDLLWDAWVKHRGKHRSDTGSTTIAAMRREATEVGWTLEQAMTEQISRGWRGFKSKWVKDDDQRTPNVTPLRQQPARHSLVEIARGVAADLEREAQARASF